MERFEWEVASQPENGKMDLDDFLNICIKILDLSAKIPDLDTQISDLDTQIPDLDVQIPDLVS